MDTATARVLMVDDEPVVLEYLEHVLAGAGYDCRTAGSPEEAIARLDGVDLLLSDISMPAGSGIELVVDARRRDPDLAVVMVTARDDRDMAARVTDLGADGYVIKPFSANQILIAAHAALRRRALSIDNRRHTESLEVLVEERTSDLARSQRMAVQKLAHAIELRDTPTGEHVRRMSDLVGRLARALGGTQSAADRMALAATLHDVGKIAVPDGILRKRGPLEPDERAAMQQHTAFGHDLLAGSGSALLDVAAEIAWTHHERFDGAGYPRGLEGSEIPLAGRIAAVADVFDALTSSRCYRPEPFSEADALRMIEDGRGTQFDPSVVDALAGLCAAP